VPQSGILRLPSTARLEGLLEQIEALPRHRKCLDRAQFRVYLATLLRVRDALVLALRKIRRHEQCDYQRGYLARLGAIYLDSPPDVFTSFLAGKRNRRGQNVAAVAMARVRRATSQQLSEWGRKGADSRWQSACSLRRPDPHPTRTLLAGDAAVERRTPENQAAANQARVKRSRHWWPRYRVNEPPNVDSVPIAHVSRATVRSGANPVCIPKAPYTDGAATRDIRSSGAGPRDVFPAKPPTPRQRQHHRCGGNGRTRECAQGQRPSDR
jgi:hypothetical protein